MKPKIDIIIPHYGDRNLLEQNLPVIIKNSPEINHIYIIDDTASDSLASLSSEFKNIEIIDNQANIGFTKSANIGFSHSDADLVVLLNNDVYPEKNYIGQTLKYFDDPKVFAVNFNETHSSWPFVTWHNGKLQYVRSEDKSKAVYTAWASGGSAIFRKSIWDNLGGFDEIYSPGYWEDIDIGWRAWKSGYKIIWQPGGVVVHQHEASFSKLNLDFINLLKQRNELIFIWKNISSKNLLLDHISFLITYTIRHPGYIKVISAALFKIHSAAHSPQELASDASILSLLNQPV